ncbi:MAG: hypothetical protein GKS01_16315 [Alphaproteobacteria bacterium]|nr:hypothetical protein [Alphaproteobacteria bacterium]
MKKALISAVAATAALAIGATTGNAQDAMKTYKDRTVTILVGYGAGGTYGQTSLLIARHFGKTIPGNPTVIVQHMPGAGGLKATNYAAKVMPKNGKNVLMPPEMTVVSQLLRPKKIKFNAKQFTWLGRVFGANQVMAIRRDAGVVGIAGMKKKSLVVASTGTGSPTFLVPAMMNGILKTKFRIVTGYKGSANSSLSVEQGETFGMSNSWVSWKKNRPQWWNKPGKNFLIGLVQVGYNKEPDLPNLPLLTDLAKSPDDKAAAAMLSTAAVIGRGLAFPPGAPTGLVKPMQDAFWKMVTSSTFKADAKKRGLPVTPLRGPEIQKIVNDSLGMAPSAVKKARAHIFGRKKK